MFKKLILSSFVVVAFALYVFVAHHEDGTHKVTPPSLLQLSAGRSSSQNGSASTSSNSSSSSSSSNTAAAYKDGTYTGNVADAFYGNIQVQAVIHSGKITDVQFLQYPNDRQTSIDINSQAMPYLKQEAIQAQSAQVNVITGATYSSQAFIESLTAALAQAKQ